ncbi:MAG: hypothetical protein IKR25_02070 [Muribaculaceae bacterium]|nr:hypothetical protein [Muribaculaceae bacterium]
MKPIRYSLIAAAMLLLLGARATAQTLPLQGSGASDDPYLISSYADLKALSYATNELGMDCQGLCFLFTNDIDMEGVTDFVPLSGEVPFTGILDGNGYSIRNWVFNYHVTTEVMDFRPSALLVRLGEGGAIQRLSIDASCQFNVGGNFAPLVYDVAGSVYNCYNYADIVADHEVGGIVCRVQPSGGVGGCFNAGSIAGVRSGYAGGIAARSMGSISRCQFAGTLSGSQYARLGGVVGECASSVGNCLSTGVIKGVDVIGGLVAVPCPGAGITNSLCTAVLIPAGNTTQVGAMVGVPDVLKVTFSQNAYDRQITIYNNIDEKYAGGVSTQQLIDTIWSGSRAWTKLPGTYPMLWQFHTERAAIATAGPVVFADGDTRLTMTQPARLYHDLSDSFWWTLDGDEAFYLDDESRLAVHAITQPVSTTLTANHGGFTHAIPVTAIVPEPKPDVDQLNAIINQILNMPTAGDGNYNTDVNGDGNVDIDDVNLIINRILAQ